MMENRYEKEAHELCEAIRKLAAREDALINFESYLSQFFPVWLDKYGTTPEDLVGEFMWFANMFDERN